MTVRKVSSYFPLYIYIALLIVFLFFRRQPSFSLADIQYYITPGFFLVIYFLFLRKLAIGRVVTILAFVLLLVCFYFYKPNNYFTQGSYISARFKNDQYQTASVILNDLINGQMDKLGRVRLGEIPLELASLSEAKEYLRQNQEVKFVLWGKSNWINLTLRSDGNTYFSQYLLTLALPDIEIISTPPTVGVFYEPKEYTSRFIAHLLNAFQNLAGDNFNQGVLQLRRAGRMAAVWKNQGHVSLPLFMLGNLSLYSVLNSERYQQGELNCAIEFYQAALDSFLRNQNPEMAAAIANNLGAAFYLRYLLDDYPRDRLKAKKYFALSIKSAEFKNPYSIRYLSPNISKANLKILKLAKINKKKRQAKKKLRKKLKSASHTRDIIQ